MPCAPTHILINSLVMGGGLALVPPGQGQRPLPHPVVGAGLGVVLARLPDLVEPATRNPNHRQFFHSIVFACVVGYGVYRAYHWQAVTPLEQLLRVLALTAGTAYLLHLAADAITARGIPLIGRC